MLYMQHGEPYGLSSRMKLWEKAKSINPSITMDDVRAFLRSNKTYTLHKLQNKKFPRQKIIASKPKTIMAADLADVRHIRKENNNNGYLLVCIDDQPWGNVIPEKLSPIITSIWSEVHTLNVPNTPPQ